MVSLSVIVTMTVTVTVTLTETATVTAIVPIFLSCTDIVNVSALQVHTQLTNCLVILLKKYLV